MNTLLSGGFPIEFKKFNAERKRSVGALIDET